MQFNRQLLNTAAASMLAMAATASQAAITVTEVVSEIDGTLAPIGAIGSAVLIVYVSIKAFKWVRRAL